MDLKSNILKITDWIKECHTETIDVGEDRPLLSSDFKDFINKSEKKLSNICSFLDEIVSSCGYEALCDKDLIISMFILFGENNILFSWNNEFIISKIKHLHSYMGFLASNVKSSVDEDILVLGISKFEKNVVRPIFRPMLLQLRPKLLKNSFRKNPGSVQCYKWLMDILRFPYMNEVIPDVLPTALILTDDFVNENKILGVQCLSRIIQNATIAELKYYGYGELIYTSLKHLLRVKEKELAVEVTVNIFMVVNKLETDFGDVDDVFKWSRYDDVLEILLEVVELESYSDLRHAYLFLMEVVITSLGKRVERWAKRFLQIFDTYLYVADLNNDINSTQLILSALKKLLGYLDFMTFYLLQNVVFIIFRTCHNLIEDVRKRSVDCEHVLCLIQEIFSVLLEREEMLKGNANLKIFKQMKSFQCFDDVLVLIKEEKKK